ncbi:GntR family transcriptional regulator [Halocynthiibacter sp. C4]|uniref:GntR family transcriptional regulator n=1 Tax=Halocynthiibacter sp. C4 TaxID=2992758 RepID=UPI00237C4443|nr:GntR family transcriptional regulator [Halocynthiibacter sp. C4]MDE0589164.1 GntR family transcriptional regulator [Halocynthiibacter sp. C4]
MSELSKIYAPDAWFKQGGGPRYQQLQRHISELIQSGKISADERLPPEREMAEIACVSRVTIRKAVAQLVADGLVEQRQGAGSYVRKESKKLKQSLSTLISFTENMSARGKTSSSEILAAGLFTPNPDEMVTLGLSGTDKVARVRRLRSAGETPMALESSSLPQDILPFPERVKVSLYKVLRERGQAPVRAIQRVTAVNVSGEDAELLRLPEGSAVLRIERTGYLASRRPIEFTSGLYRSDIYDFISELGAD